MKQRTCPPDPDVLKNTLESLYVKYNRRAYVTPDPLQFLYDYPKVQDREIVGLIAAGLAYGRVAQILKSVDSVLKKMEPSPCDFIIHGDARDFTHAFEGFVHRFSKGSHMVALLTGIKEVVSRFGSLSACFARGMNPSDENVLPGMHFLVAQLLGSGRDPGHLISLPWKKSACKRLNLYLRWMVRTDDVDPGGWDRVSPATLLMPLDTHIFRICAALGLTQKKQANLAAALEITRRFQDISPHDPVKYDFVLSRFGIRPELNMVDLINEF